MTKDWRRHREEATQLYRSGKSVSYVQRTLAANGFKASIRSYRLRFKEWGILKTVDTLGPSTPGRQGLGDANRTTSGQIGASASFSNKNSTSIPCTCQQRSEQQVPTPSSSEVDSEEPADGLIVPQPYRAATTYHHLPLNASQTSQAEGSSVDRSSLLYLVESICVSPIPPARVDTVESRLAARLFGSNTSLRGNMDGTAAARLALEGGQYKCLNVLLNAGATFVTEDNEDVKDTLDAVQLAFACEAGAVVHQSLLNLILALEPERKESFVSRACEGIAQSPTAIPLVEGLVKQLLQEIERYSWKVSKYGLRKYGLRELITWILRSDGLAGPSDDTCNEIHECFMLACKLIGGITESLYIPYSDQKRICPADWCNTGIDYLLNHLPSGERPLHRIESMITSADRTTIMSLTQACVLPCWSITRRKSPSHVLDLHKRCLEQRDISDLQSHLTDIWTTDYDYGSSAQAHIIACSKQVMNEVSTRDVDEKRAFFELSECSDDRKQGFSGMISMFRRLLCYLSCQPVDKWALSEVLLGESYHIRGTDDEVLLHSVSDWRYYLPKEYLYDLVNALLGTTSTGQGCTSTLDPSAFELSSDSTDKYENYKDRGVRKMKDVVHAFVVHVVTKIAFEDLLEQKPSLVSEMIERFYEMHDILKARKDFGLPDIAVDNAAYSSFLHSFLERWVHLGIA